MFSIFNVYVLTKNECPAGFEFKGNKCECAKKLSSDGLQCIPKCADVGEALNERGIPNSCYKCPDKITREDDSYCSLTVSCGANAKPDLNTGYSTCTCNDSSLVLNQDKKSCSCPPKTYFNAFERTCLSCPSGTSPDPLQTFCVCSSIQYFEVKSKTCQPCPKNSFTSSSSNVCNCMKFKQYIREEQCKDCGGGSTGSSADGLSCLCDDNKKISARFDELQSKCIPCGYPFQTAMVIKDRSVCICPILGQVNINNESCHSCPATAVNKNPGVQNVDGCQCINSSYFWSAMNNTCTLCPFGVANSENKCVCPPNSQIDNLNNSCLCYGNSFFDGHSCVECPKDSNVVENVCRFNSSANPYHLQAECPRKSTPNAENTTCVCDGNFFYTRSNNSCTECPFSSSIANNVCEINQYAGKELLPSCGVHAMPDKASGNVTCVCNDSSLVLLSDGINCGCPSQKYFNSVLRTCLECPSGLSPDGTQSFCVCSSKYYFDLEYQSCLLCPKDSLTTPYSNVCNCKKDKAYVRMVKGDEKCEGCGGGAKSSTFDSQSCSCDDNKKENTRFDELQNKCVPCGSAFLTAMTYKDRSVCICKVIGEVNINNQSCQTCPSNSVNKNPGVQNVDGCQCINSSFFWSAQNNTCTLCPFGVSNSDNQCVCPRYSQLNTKNDGCICYGNFIFDGHSCIESNNCPSQSYQTTDQNGLPTCISCPIGSAANNISKTCICSGNFFYQKSNNSCVQCPVNSQVSNNVCSCSGESYQVSVLNGVPSCFLCPSGSKANQVNLTCDCDGNSVYDQIKNICNECPQNSLVSNNTCSCSQQSYQQPTQDGSLSCYLCPSGSKANQDNLTCDCDGNFFYQESSKSCVECPANSQVSGNICVCSIQSYQLQSQNSIGCFLCPFGSAPNQVNQTCDCSGNSFNDVQSNSCIMCPTNSQVSNNVCYCSGQSYQVSISNGLPTCFLCPAGSKANQINQTCDCDVNKIYDLQSNSCTSCPDNSISVQNTCVCSELSYQASDLSCVLCPSGSNVDQIDQSCICSGNFFYQTSNNSCVQCPVNSQVSNNVCSCSGESYLVSVLNGIPSCFLCPPGSKANNISKTCDCDGNSVYDSNANICVECPDSFISQNNSCVCSEVSYLQVNQDGSESCIECPANSQVSNNICSCIEGAYQVSVQNGLPTCQLCPENSVVVANACECSESSYQQPTQDGTLKCFLCPAGSKANAVTQTCDCYANSVYDSSSNSCTCVEQSYLQLSQDGSLSCVLCPAGSKPIGQTCECDGNSIFFESACVECLDNSLAISNKCECSGDSYQVSIQNGLPICFLCPQDSKANQITNTCDCSGNSVYDSSSSSCVACPDNSISKNNICVCSSSSYQLNSDDNSLVCFSCPQDSTPNQQSQTCDCPANSIYTKQSNSCTKCLPNSISVNNACVCSDSSYQDSDLSCVLCPSESTVNQKDKTCVCSENSFYDRSSNTCVTCPKNSIQVNNVCVCSDLAHQTSTQNNRPVCILCENSVFDPKQNICVPCSTGTVFKNNQCVCSDVLQVYNGRECVFCPDNARIQNNQCVCDQNQRFDLINNLCTFCQNGFYMFKTTCVVKCPAGYIAYLNKCQQVNKSTVWIYAVVSAAIFALIISTIVAVLIIKRRIQKRTATKTNVRGRDTMYYARRLHQNKNQSSSSSLSKLSSQGISGSESNGSQKKRKVTKPLENQQNVKRPVQKPAVKMNDGINSSNSSGSFPTQYV
ncbi:Conserved_hypothetical protein [Hexamita inflata]|uniref:Uncharacterized protein n=1 Tax=Hexamita inflata TaxID=28002 RepID=A0ABP1JGA9_9EUKA